MHTAQDNGLFHRRECVFDRKAQPKVQILRVTEALVEKSDTGEGIFSDQHGASGDKVAKFQKEFERIQKHAPSNYLTQSGFQLRVFQATRPDDTALDQIYRIAENQIRSCSSSSCHEFFQQISRPDVVCILKSDPFS